MASKRYRAVRKRDRKGLDVWGVAAFEPLPGKPWRQVAWKTVGRGEKAEIEARVLAAEMERQEAGTASASYRGTRQASASRSIAPCATTSITTARRSAAPRLGAMGSSASA